MDGEMERHTINRRNSHRIKAGRKGLGWKPVRAHTHAHTRAHTRTHTGQCSLLMGFKPLIVLELFYSSVSCRKLIAMQIILL